MQTIEQLINVPSMWLRLEGQYKVWAPMPTGPIIQYVTDDEVKAFDERLVEVLPAMQLHYGQQPMFDDVNPEREFPGQLVRHTLMLWDRPQFLIDKYGGKHYYYELCNVIDFDYQPGSESLEIEVLGYTVNHIKTEGSKDIQFVERLVQYPVEVAASWLESQYSGWERRMLTALGLGYDFEQLLPIVFSKEMLLPPVSLNHVAFE